MTPFITAFLLGIGVMAWVYNKFMRTTGGNTANSLTASGIIGFIAFLLMWMIMSMIS